MSSENQRDVSRLILMGPRSSGKSTTARRLSDRLNWRFVDIDVEFRRLNKSARKSWHFVSSETYYSECREILMNCLGQDNVVIALGGGTLFNNREDLNAKQYALIECQKYAELVLLLPSRSEFISRCILKRREKQRDYETLTRRMKDEVKRIAALHLRNRLHLFEDNADFIAYGKNADRLAKSIMQHYELEEMTA